MKKASQEPYAATVTLKELGTAFYKNCTHRREGTITGASGNDCEICFRHLCSLDGHKHLDDLVPAIIAWFALLWKGKKSHYVCKIKN